MDFAEQIQEDNFWDRVITHDETRCYQCDHKAKRQSMERRPKKPRMSKSKTKIMLSCFLKITTLNLYLKRLIDSVRRKRVELWRHRTLILHHANAPENPLFGVP
jgi:hypothetical protein